MGLRGKTVLITRTASQSEELREGLSRLGARVIECPTIQIVPVDDWSLVDRAISNLTSYHWLLFTSANAVDCFMKRVEAVGASVNVNIAVVGSATANKLADYRLTASLTPETYRAEGLLQGFPSDLNGVRILFPRAETARELLPEELRGRGATVDVVTVYRTVKAEGLPDIKEVLAREHIDCVVFTSPSTIRFMAETFETDLATALKGIAVAVIGPVTQQAAESHSLKVTIQPNRSTVPDLIQAITHYLGV
jgi:uroporphyrinogen-III synthase